MKAQYWHPRCLWRIDNIDYANVIRGKHPKIHVINGKTPNDAKCAACGEAVRQDHFIIADVTQAEFDAAQTQHEHGQTA